MRLSRTLAGLSTEVRLTVSRASAARAPIRRQRRGRTVRGRRVSGGSASASPGRRAVRARERAGRSRARRPDRGRAAAAAGRPGSPIESSRASMRPARTRWSTAARTTSLVQPASARAISATVGVPARDLGQHQAQRAAHQNNLPDLEDRHGQHPGGDQLHADAEQRPARPDLAPLRGQRRHARGVGQQEDQERQHRRQRVAAGGLVEGARDRARRARRARRSAGSSTA